LRTKDYLMVCPPVEVDMTTTTSFAWSVFLGGVMSGWAIYELYRRHKDCEETLAKLEEDLHESREVEHLHQEMLEETDRRIREKQDYDETQEVEEGKYQAWKGLYEQDEVKVSIMLYREKESTLAKNQEWVSWEGDWNGSCVVRDFYLGNSSPEFQWKVLQSEEWQRGLVEETMVNGWDSVVKLEIAITVESGSTCSDWNGMLRSFFPKIVWSRILLDA
jgi:hypothetical protein